MDSDVSGGLSNAADNVPTAEANLWLYDALYDYDASLNAAAALAEPASQTSAPTARPGRSSSSDGVKFHDGTAHDRAMTSSRRTSSPRARTARYNPSVCLTSFLDKVEAVDDLTVKFTLKQPLATFATIFLPGIFIENKDAVDASYARYAAGDQAPSPRPRSRRSLTRSPPRRRPRPVRPPRAAPIRRSTTRSSTPMPRPLLTKAGQALRRQGALHRPDGGHAR